MFTDKSQERDVAKSELPGPPDARAGLYIQSRAGVLHHVKIPRHCLAFQTGEALELATDGKLRAVPHLVYGGEPRLMQNIGRSTLAVFMQPSLGDRVGKYDTFAQWASDVLSRGYDKS